MSAQPDYSAYYLPSDERLNEILCQLKKTRHSRTGLSSSFRTKSFSQEQALFLCNSAIQALSTQYVANLETFKESPSITNKLLALVQAEKIWSKNTPTITHFDEEGTEQAFLLEMRKLALFVLEEQLISASKECFLHPTEEKTTLCTAILLVMDQIYEELGHPETSPMRQQIIESAKALS